MNKHTRDSFLTERDIFFKRMQDRFKSDIAEYGLTVVGVAGHGDDPTFTYTIGLSEAHGFEIIVVGLRPDHAHIIFNVLARRLKSGESVVADGTVDTELANLPSMFKLCKDELVKDYVVQLRNYYGNISQIPVYQLVLPDKRGRFPGEHNFDEEYMAPRQKILY